MTNEQEVITSSNRATLSLLVPKRLSRHQYHNQLAALHRKASLSPVLLGCSALSGLRTRCAN